MILPKKHLPIDECVLGFGAYLLQHLSKPMAIDSLWKVYLGEFEKSIYSTKFSFDQFIIVIDFLYAIEAITINEKGELMYAINQTDSE
jgi:hypothetical protein